MKIDRSAFLLMTGAIAGSAACVIQAGPPTTTTPTVATAAPSTATAPTPVATPPVPVGGPHRVGTPSLFGNFTHNNTGITTPPPTPTPSNPTCLDEGAASNLPACQAGSGSTCAAQVTAQCGVYGQVLEPKIAAAAVQCLSAQSAANQCTQASVVQCGQQALASACASTDSGATQACAQAAAVAACGATQQQCIAQVSGFSQAGVQALSSCIVEGGNLCASNTLAGCVQKVLLTAPSAEGGGCTSTATPPTSASGVHH